MSERSRVTTPGPVQLGGPDDGLSPRKEPEVGWQVVRHRAGMRRIVIIGTVIVAIGLLAGGAFAVTKGGGSGQPSAATAPADTSSASSAAASADEPLTVSAVEPPSATELPAPDRVKIAAIGVDSSLEQLDLDAAGKLKPPSAYTHAGWFAKGPAPGDLGPAVIAGHVDSVSGPAVFARLGELKAGDIVEVSRGGTWLRFSVVTVEHYAKTEFPTDKVYRPTPIPELRLITCGGTFDHNRHSYLDNYVVYAVVVT
jgi:LPXTG-site transpeptidase (sortase) family protein